jgi:hypothetical protein
VAIDVVAIDVVAINVIAINVIAMTHRTPVYLEIGKKRVFACALDWPGWCRSGRTEELALDALAGYAPRYAVVAKVARVAFPRNIADSFQVVERLPGSASTDFGVPEQFATLDTEPVPAAVAQTMTALVVGAWSVFDRVAAITPSELRKGPRGGGRDRDKMIDHVIASETSYARKLGIKHKLMTIDDHAAIAALRNAISDVLSTGSDGAPPVPNGWPLRYAARRIAWHALDHAWEMEDRTER